MDRKILFFDIDGTILSHRTYTISESTKLAIQKAQANGHLAFINTGRVISAIPRELLELGFDGFVCGCGTYVSYRDQILLQKFIPEELTKRMIVDLRELGLDAVLEGSDAIYYDDSTTNPIVKRVREYHDNNGFPTGSWDDHTIVINKFCIWSSLEIEIRTFMDKYTEYFDFIDRKQNLYEVVPKGYSKASGIQFLIDHLNIPFESTYAFGDGENDLPMLQYAKHTIAMGNAPQAIKDIVSFVSLDVDEGGIQYALEHYGLI
jgi:Cof subfamily protein (haloacid dehalogenase superfamily)